jgi:hypothetical protein
MKMPTMRRATRTLLLSGILAAPMLTVPANAGPESIGFDGALPSLHEVEIDNAHVYDYTFASAPVDWRVQSGVWEMTNRWSCSPGWSWFGGRSEEIASVWNKRRFSGDFSVQFYFAFKMGLTKTEKWHYKPSDVAISFCGDGQNLGSGYSFVIGANDNKQSVLMKRGKVVAESAEPDAILPSLVDGNPANEVLHRKWWYAKVNRIGNRIECWLDNKLLFAYNDSQPIDAGQIALWTYNNGIMLSRVQIFYENEVRPDFLRKAAVPARAPQKTVAVNANSVLARR